MSEKERPQLIIDYEANTFASENCNKGKKRDLSLLIINF